MTIKQLYPTTAEIPILRTDAVKDKSYYSTRYLWVSLTYFTIVEFGIKAMGYL